MTRLFYFVARHLAVFVANMLSTGYKEDAKKLLWSSATLEGKTRCSTTIHGHTNARSSSSREKKVVQKRRWAVVRAHTLVSMSDMEERPFKKRRRCAVRPLTVIPVVVPKLSHAIHPLQKRRHGAVSYPCSYQRATMGVETTEWKKLHGTAATNHTRAHTEAVNPLFCLFRRSEVSGILFNHLFQL